MGCQALCCGSLAFADAPIPAAGSSGLQRRAAARSAVSVLDRGLEHWPWSEPDRPATLAFVELPRSRSAKPTPARAQVVTSFYLALAIAGFLWHAISQGNNDFWRAPGVGTLDLLWTPLLGAGFGLLVVALFRSLERRMQWLPTLHREFRGILGRPTGTELIVLAAASAIGEEIFFRAAMLDAWGPWLSSLVFALLHVPPRRELWPWTISAGLFGLCLAGLTMWTGNLGAAIVAHFVINAINLAYITRQAPAIVLRGRIEPRAPGVG